MFFVNFPFSGFRNLMFHIGEKIGDGITAQYILSEANPTQWDATFTI